MGKMLILLFLIQSHIRVLESSQENISALLLGLEYLIGISYVDDTEVFKVCLLDLFTSIPLYLNSSFFVVISVHLYSFVLDWLLA